MTTPRVPTVRPDQRPADEVRLTLAPDAAALARARRFLNRYALQSGLPAERADDLVQAAAELMAVGGCTHRVTALAVRERSDLLSVRVDLAGPAVVDLAEEAAVLLDGLSSRWGWRHLPGSTQVWCEVGKDPAPGSRRA